MDPILNAIAHRPWPLPAGQWIMKQVWHDLLFAHWPVSPDSVRALVPAQLMLDTFDNCAWIGVVPFHMSGIRLHGLPSLPGLSRFPELNVRTYVTYGGKLGVYFFSLDAANLPAVWAARRFYHLPYFHASMSSREAGGDIHYFSRRHEGSAEFRGHYRPAGKVQLRAPGTFEHWATERYCLYTVPREDVYRCEIHHLQWPLQDGEAEFEVNTIATASGIALPEAKPRLHFARRLHVLIWPLRHAD